jgi:hypothetical protein
VAGLDEVQRLEAMSPVSEAIRAGIIEDDEDMRAEYTESMTDVPAFSVQG